jgi:hypothetical protein
MNLFLPLTMPNGSPVYESSGEQLMAHTVVIKKILTMLPRSVADLSAMASLATKIQDSPSDFSVTELEQKILNEAIKFSGPFVKRAIDLASE